MSVATFDLRNRNLLSLFVLTPIVMTFIMGVSIPRVPLEYHKFAAMVLIALNSGADILSLIAPGTFCRMETEGLCNAHRDDEE